MATAMAMAKADFIGDCYRLIMCEKCGKCEKCENGFCANFAFWETLTPSPSALRKEGKWIGGDVMKVCRRHICHAGDFGWLVRCAGGQVYPTPKSPPRTGEGTLQFHRSIIEQKDYVSQVRVGLENAGGFNPRLRDIQAH